MSAETDEEFRVIAAGGPEPALSLGGPGFYHAPETDEAQADWDSDLDVDDGADLDPCNHCPHDNTDHRGDGCLYCGCDVPQ